MKVTVVFDQQGSIIAVSELPAEKKDVRDPSVAINANPAEGYSVHELELPEGLKMAPGLISKLRVDMRGSPRLVPDTDRGQKC